MDDETALRREVQRLRNKVERLKQTNDVNTTAEQISNRAHIRTAEVDAGVVVTNVRRLEVTEVNGTILARIGG